jgi:hypothetical protein
MDESSFRRTHVGPPPWNRTATTGGRGSAWRKGGRTFFRLDKKKKDLVPTPDRFDDCWCFARRHRSADHAHDTLRDTPARAGPASRRVLGCQLARLGAREMERAAALGGHGRAAEVAGASGRASRQRRPSDRIAEAARPGPTETSARELCSTERYRWTAEFVRGSAASCGSRFAGGYRHVKAAGSFTLEDVAGTAAEPAVHGAGARRQIVGDKQATTMGCDEP